MLVPHFEFDPLLETSREKNISLLCAVEDKLSPTTRPRCSNLIELAFLAHTRPIVVLGTDQVLGNELSRSVDMHYGDAQRSNWKVFSSNAVHVHLWYTNNMCEWGFLVCGARTYACGTPIDHVKPVLNIKYCT